MNAEPITQARPEPTPDQRLARTRMATLAILGMAGLAPVMGRGFGPLLKVARKTGDCEVCGKKNVRAARQGVFRCAQHLHQ